MTDSVGATRGILSSSVEVLSTAMTATMPRAPSLCNACVDGYERERAEMASAERAPCHAEQPMSQWLQIGMPTSARPVDRAQVGSFFLAVARRVHVMHVSTSMS